MLLIATNGFWLYQAIDLAVIEKYRQQKEYETKKRTETLEKLCSKLVGGMKKSEAVKPLNEISRDFGVYEKEGKLNTVCLSFKVDSQGNVVKSDACK